LTDHTGWAWFIPISKDTVSIGACIHEKYMKEKKDGKTQQEVYHDIFSQLEMVNDAKADSVLVPNKDGGSIPVYMASDFSYLAENVGAKNYRLVGDAAGVWFNSYVSKFRVVFDPQLFSSAFIDPFFSNGVHIAFVGSLSAALSIISIIEGHATEDVAAGFHNRELKSVYMRFFVVVAAAYRQMWGGELDILNDVDETTCVSHRLQMILMLIFLFQL
jgi:flavin-dependent dehydrogenase